MSVVNDKAQCVICLKWCGIDVIERYRGTCAFECMVRKYEVLKDLEETMKRVCNYKDLFFI